MGWPTFPKCPQANSTRLVLGAWLKMTGSCEEAFEINFLEFGCQAAEQLFAEGFQSIAIRQHRDAILA